METKEKDPCETHKLNLNLRFRMKRIEMFRIRCRQVLEKKSCLFDVMSSEIDQKESIKGPVRFNVIRKNILQIEI